MKYYYFDNWSGSMHEFKRLCDAIVSAKKQTGVSITIYRDKKLSDGRRLMKIVPASGHCPA